MSNAADLSRNASARRSPDADAAATLRRGVVFSVREETGVLELNNKKYHFGGVPPRALFEVLTRLDGRRSPAEVAARAGLEVELVRDIVGELFKHNLAIDFGGLPDEPITPPSFVALCRGLFPAWKQQLGAHPLCRLLAGGQAGRAQFMGWLMENHHFIEGIHDRLALAISECHDRGLLPLLAQHYAEEHDHSYFYMASLNHLGVDAPTVLAARPLPGTRAVLNFMRQCARRDPLQYGVCTAFFESSGGTREAAEEYYDALMGAYVGEKREAIASLVEHVALDNACGHDSLLDEIAERSGPLSPARASAALGACALLVETLHLWLSDIERAYDLPEVKLRDRPRPYRPTSSNAQAASDTQAVPEIQAGVATHAALFEAVAAESQRLGDEIFGGSLRRRLAGGEASRSLILGWGLELYHYAAAVNEYMAAAVAYCHESHATRHWLVERYFERRQRAALLSRGLVASGLAEEEIAAAPPLASTRALVNFLTELAVADRLAFIAALDILRAFERGTAAADAVSFYDDLAERYPFAAGLFQSIRDYALADEGARRQTPHLLAEVITDPATLTRDAARAIATAARDTREHLVLFGEGLEDYYGGEYVFTPRRALDARAAL
jgi:pyrroloquinoline quinone (PQQ) biosynthesis protein C